MDGKAIRICGSLQVRFPGENDGGAGKLELTNQSRPPSKGRGVNRQTNSKAISDSFKLDSPCTLDVAGSDRPNGRG